MLLHVFDHNFEGVVAFFFSSLEPLSFVALLSALYLVHSFDRIDCPLRFNAIDTLGPPLHINASRIN